MISSYREQAASDADESIREKSLEAIGKALQKSRDRTISEFLAGLVSDETAPQNVRRAAYWALREAQFGFTEEESVTRSIWLAKDLLRMAREKGMSEAQISSLGIDEKQAKSKLLCAGRWPDSLWETASEIDWAFVEQFKSPQSGSV